MTDMSSSDTTAAVLNGNRSISISSSSTSGNISSTSTNTNNNWPLHKISEPHECNDVLLSGPNRRKKRGTSSPTRNNKDDKDDNIDSTMEEEPIPWRSSSIFCNESKSDDDGSHHNSQSHEEFFKGNERFFQLLVAHREDFETKNRMEQPLVTVRVLQQWRNQAPPGRFLVAETDTHPPLWNDIGDRRARARISKALKHLAMTTSAAGGGKRRGVHIASPSDAASATVATPTTSPVPTRTDSSSSHPAEAKESMRRSETEEEEKKSAEDPHESPTSQAQLLAPSDDREKARALLPKVALGEEAKPASRKQANGRADVPTPPTTTVTTAKPALPAVIRPKMPRFQKLDKHARRISEQLHSAQQDGKMYGRWKERDRLVQIYKHQRQQHKILLQQQQKLHQKLQHQQPHERQSLASSSSTMTTAAAASPIVDFVLISGTIGVGKTSLAHTLKNPLLDEEDESDNNSSASITTTITGPQPPFFLHGKFEHCKWKDPNTVFVAILADFCHQLLRRKDPLLTKRYRDAIRASSLREDITLLTNLVPALAAILKTTTVADVDGNVMTTSTRSNVEGCCNKAAENNDSYGCMAMQRIKQVLGAFLETVAAASPPHAIIVLLDDLNYASEPALDILTFLVADVSHCGILFLGTFRTDEYKDKHFTKAVKQLDASHTVQVTKMEIGNLEETSVHSMLMETLSLQEEETQSLKKIVFSVTKGNPMFINELLRNFQDKDLLQYDEASLQWTCDMEQIPLALADIRSVPDLFKAKILALPPAIQETLKIAACLMATQVDEALLKMIDTVGSVSSHLKFADIRGLLQFREGRYYFVSDGMKEAIYTLIPEAERPSYHLKIGQRLWQHLQENQNPEFYSNLMTQMMMGDQIITQEEDRRAVALLYLESGQKAAKFLGFRTAWYCLSRGISIISSQKKWGRDLYDINLSLYNTAIEVCYCNGEFSELEKLIDEVLKNARTFEDSLPAKSCQIYSLGSRNKQFEAIKIGLETLKELEEFFPCLNPNSFCLFYEARKVRKLLHGLSDNDILQLPRMKDPKKLAATQILNHVALYTIYTMPKLSALVAFRMVELTMKHGISAISSMAFVLYGMILCRSNSVNDGYRYGELAMKICDVFKKEVWTCRTWAGFYGTIYCRKHAVRGALEPLQTAYRAGMRTGGKSN